MSAAPRSRSATPIGVRDLPVDGEGSSSFGWWGMVLVIMTEGAFFVALLFAYFYLRTLHPEWPPEMPKLHLSGPNTALLIGSSVTFWWAERGIGRGRTGALKAGLAATIGLGAVFLAIQGLEYHETVRHFTPASHAYGSLFFTITGFHGAHVAIGLIMNLVILVRALLGHFDERRHGAVKVTGMYWHFVDVVWLVVFASLYLSPRLL